MRAVLLILMGLLFGSSAAFAQVIPLPDSTFESGGKSVTVGQYLQRDTVYVLPYYDNEVAVVVDPLIIPDLAAVEPEYTVVDSAHAIGEVLYILCTGSETSVSVASAIRGRDGVLSAYPLVGNGRRLSADLHVLNNDIYMSPAAGVDSTGMFQLAAEHGLTGFRQTSPTTYVGRVPASASSHVLRTVSLMNLDARVSLVSPNVWYYLRDTGIGIRSDFDRDGHVNFSDFIQFASHYGTVYECRTDVARFDLNANGAVDFPDFVIFAGQFGQF